MDGPDHCTGLVEQLSHNTVRGSVSLVFLLSPIVSSIRLEVEFRFSFNISRNEKLLSLHSFVPSIP